MDEVPQLIPSDSQLVVHGANGPYLLDKNKWPNLKLNLDSQDGDPMETLTQEDSLPIQHMGSKENASQGYEVPSPGGVNTEGDMADEDLMDKFSCRSKDSDMEEANQGWKAPKSKKSKKHKKKQVVVASRTSSRIPRDGIPIAEKATKRAMEKDNISGMTTHNPFTVLNNTPVPILHAVMTDLDIEVDNIDDQIGVFKLAELARAVVAEANYKNFLESQRNKDAPQREDDLKELTMEVISNENRDCHELFPKGGIDSDIRGASKDLLILSNPS